MKASRCYYLALVFFCITYGACDSTMKSKSPPISFDLQGHRGARGLMPENTILAMLRALEEGVTTLEMDVVISKDSQVLLSHEPWMNHEITTKPDGSFVTSAEAASYNIYKMPYAEVLTFDAGSRLHPRFPQQQKVKVHKPLLHDVITLAEAYAEKSKRSPVQYNIETKSTDSTDNLFHPAPAPFVDMLMRVVENKKVANRVVIQSFDIRTLQYLNKKYPSMKTALLVDEGSRASFAANLTALGFEPTIYSPHYSLVTAELVEACHRRNLKLIPWTVNTLPEMQRLKLLGVDGLISDYPNLYKQLL